MGRRRADSGRAAASRIGLPLLGSTAAHIGLLGALLILGAASGPRGDGAVQVLLVGGGVSAPSGAAERGFAPAGGTPRTAAVRPGEAKAPQLRPSSPSLSVAERVPDPPALPAAEEKPVPGSAPPPSPALPASPLDPAPLGQGESGGDPDPQRIGGAPEGAEEGASAAAKAPVRSPADSGDGAEPGPGPGRAAPGSTGHVRASGGGPAGGGDSAGLAALRARIVERIVYPAEAVRRGQEGEVLLRIRIGREGVPQEIRIARSSGARVLDEAARSGVVRASPLPSRPGWVEVPVRFFLR